jgi:hypothetical protein
MITVLGVNLLGDWWRDPLDPRLKVSYAPGGGKPLGCALACPKL